jgi:hypothetical protein
VTLCRHCDCYVGLGGAGVFMRPEGFDQAWLASHCWGCGRSEAEVRERPYGRPASAFQPYRIMPTTTP